MSDIVILWAFKVFKFWPPTSQELKTIQDSSRDANRQDGKSSVVSNKTTFIWLSNLPTECTSWNCLLHIINLIRCHSLNARLQGAWLSPPTSVQTPACTKCSLHMRMQMVFCSYLNNYTVSIGATTRMVFRMQDILTIMLHFSLYFAQNWNCYFF